MAHTVEDYGQPEYLDGAMMQYALADGKGRRCAYVGDKKTAHLYAAAPELLKALIALRDGPQIECVPDNGVQDLIRAAIRKATEVSAWDDFK